MKARFAKAQEKGSSAAQSGMKRERAVALSCGQQGDTPPVVHAVGEQYRAKEMKRLARRYGIPVHYDQQLTDNLGELSEREQVPEQFLDAVARIFAKIDGRK